MSGEHQLVLILDYGSQFTQLIARRVRDDGVYCEIHPFDMAPETVRDLRPIGIILSGGPQSIYWPDAPQIPDGLLDLGIPVLGICYGLQAMAHALGGQVAEAAGHEYGRAEIDVVEPGLLFRGLDRRQTVWMSHADHIERLPEGFELTASTPNAPVVGCEDRARNLYGIQFHPEVSHTTSGREILHRFLYDACGATGDWSMHSFVDEAIETIQRRTAGAHVICGLSGGVDSSVMAALVNRAVGDRMTAIFVDTGLLRKNEAEQVSTSLGEGLGLPIITVDAADRFLSELAGVGDPETKRKIIGRVFVEVFEEQAQAIEDARFLAQGTLYPDVIESSSVKGPSAVIKTHHNVGGLPEKLGFKLVEPLRDLFKDEVRRLGRELGLPEELISRHPFPGPGLAVRILGEITPERVALLQAADAIFIDELRGAGFYEKTSQAFAVLLGVKSVGVMGDGRTYEDVVALRSVDTHDFMTADWSPLPYDFLGRVANRIVNEVRGINRVVYDITSKPPATIEWE